MLDHNADNVTFALLVTIIIISITQVNMLEIFTTVD